MEPISQLCERARTWASLRADGELSELEAALLDAHLSRCPACIRFARGFEGVAGALRAERPVRPAPLALSLPRRRFRLLYAAAIALLVLGAGATAFFVAPSGGRTPAKPVAMVAAVESPDALRELRRPLLIERRNIHRGVDV